MFDGYLNRPDATAEAVDADGWYRTGDVAVIDADGMHRIVGRESVDLIKTGGFRVGAGEIETALLGHPGVDEVAVVGLPDDDLGQRIVAFVVGDVDPDALIELLLRSFRCTSDRGRCGWWTACRATRWARCSKRSGRNGV